MAGKEEDNNNHFSGYVSASCLDFVLCSSFCQLLFVVPPVSLRALFDLCQLRIFTTSLPLQRLCFLPGHFTHVDSLTNPWNVDLHVLPFACGAVCLVCHVGMRC